MAIRGKYNIGSMDRYCSFQDVVSTKTTGGSVAKVFTHSFYAWCSREMIGDGTEEYVNDRLISPYRYKYRTHYTTGINEAMRMVDDSQIYDIKAINPDGLFIEMYVEKVTL
ncbi:MAG: head-tail adaptor protein [Bacteroidales bacterium]|nr:head-tail adaptor protein [Bacteroidales bacterium]